MRIKLFNDNYEFEDKPIEFIHHQVRLYGQPKLKKPKELNKIKQSFSVDYIPKRCRCQCFVVGDDVWVQHRDYFSSPLKIAPEDAGLDKAKIVKKYLGKDVSSGNFVYPDAWASIILKNEAWIVIKNLAYNVRAGKFILAIKDEILRQQEKLNGFEPYELEVGEMERFWEKVINETERYIEES